jgi:hypothetical protein
MSVIRFKAPKTCQVDSRGPLVQYGDYLKLELKLAALTPVWQAPDLIPNVEAGTEEQFWIAVHSERTGEPHVYLAIYQNRPLTLDENGECTDDDCLVTPDGDPHESIGWVTDQAHHEFDNYYEPIEFSEKYKLLAWAAYQAPAFTGLDQGGVA